MEPCVVGKKMMEMVRIRSHIRSFSTKVNTLHTISTTNRDTLLHTHNLTRER